MLDLIKKLTRNAGGKRNAVLLLALVLIGVLLTAIGTPSLDARSPSTHEKSIRLLCEKVSVGREVYVEVNTDSSGEVIAIAVICNNGDDPNLKLKLTQMLSTLYCIPAARIYVTSFG